MYFPTQVPLRTQSYRDGESNSSLLINLFYVICFYSIGDGLNTTRQIDKNNKLWAVRKQKGVSRSAMLHSNWLHLDAVLN